MGWLELIGTPSDGILHQSDCTWTGLFNVCEAESVEQFCAVCACVKTKVQLATSYMVI